ncbi:endonuclease domain-containing protein [Paraburkholderia caribensis MBA4]|uniref:Endonuclease domain-containing protein n=1 Tax=Paraburkholderia caribensis MBA4 TaxID=1323664 RepID=A0A0P0RFD7_9BURK|nr:endonuclease domain-containing protein [Paraburkholderia caribensis MBA4]
MASFPGSRPGFESTKSDIFSQKIFPSSEKEAETPSLHLSKNFPHPNDFATSIAPIGQASRGSFLYCILIWVELFRINWES